MKRKFFITTTIPLTLGFFKGFLSLLSGTYDVCAISSQKELLKEFGEDEGIRIHYIPMKRSISLINDFLCLFRFIWFFLKERPHLVHGNTPKASMLSMLAAKLCGIKVRIYMCHGLRYQGTEGKMRWLLMQMEKLTCFCATEVICVSHGIKETMVEDGLCAPRKAVVIHFGSASGIDLEKFKIEDKEPVRNRNRAILGIGVDAFVFVFVSRIVKDKGINELVNSFVKLDSIKKEIHLILVGRFESDIYPLPEKTLSIIENHENIHAVGYKIDIKPYLLSADAFVFPSYREGFGMALIEAGALGLASLTTDIIGCNEIIINEVNGELIPPKDENALYLKMKEWVESPAKVKLMGNNARKLIENRYDQKFVWNKQLEEYHRLLAKPHICTPFFKTPTERHL